MHERDHEELMSAYLDGELSPAERARAEELLATEPALRELYEELRATRESLRGLPRYKLERDLAADVVRQAQTARAASGSAGTTSEAILPSGDFWSRERTLRRLLWPALAVAAALLIAFFEMRPNGEVREVAQQRDRMEAAPAAPPATDDGPARGRALSETSARPESGANLEFRAGSEMSTVGKPADREAKLEGDYELRLDRKAGNQQAAGATKESTPPLSESVSDEALGRGLNRDTYQRESEALGLDWYDASGNLAKDAAGSTSATLPLYAYFVAPEFINQKKLEGLLQKQRIEYQPIPSEESVRDRLDQVVKNEWDADTATPLVRQYRLTVTPEQLEPVLQELQQARIAPARSARSSAVDAPAVQQLETTADKRAAGSGGRGGGASLYFGTNPQQVLIRLQATAQPTAASEPAAARPATLPPNRED